MSKQYKTMTRGFNFNTEVRLVGEWARVQHLIDDLLAATASLNSILSQVDTDITPILHKVDNGLDQFTSLVNHGDEMIISLDEQIRPLVTNINTTFTNIDSTLQQADELLAQAQKSI